MLKSLALVEAEVDHDTGAVRIHDVLLAADVGTIINPLAHQGQLEGGLMFGIGAGLISILRRDADAPPDAVSDVANSATSPVPAAVKTPGR